MAPEFEALRADGVVIPETAEEDLSRLLAAEIELVVTIPDEHGPAAMYLMLRAYIEGYHKTP